jgi:hypothetical protein
MKFKPYLALKGKFNSQWIMDLNVKHKTIK